jgi:hypothetical protein
MEGNIMLLLILAGFAVFPAIALLDPNARTHGG